MSYHVTICHNHIVSYDTLVFKGKSHEFRIPSPCSQHFCWYLSILVAIPVADAPIHLPQPWAAGHTRPSPTSCGMRSLMPWTRGPGELRVFSDASIGDTKKNLGTCTIFLWENPLFLWSFSIAMLNGCVWKWLVPLNPMVNDRSLSRF